MAPNCRSSYQKKILVTMTTVVCLYTLLCLHLYRILHQHLAVYEDSNIEKWNGYQHKLKTNVHRTWAMSRIGGHALPSQYRTRHGRMLDNCASGSRHTGLFSEEEFRRHLLVDRKHQIVFCGTEKVGLTFWRRVFAALKDTHLSSPYEIKAFNAYIPGTVDTMLNKSMHEVHNILSTSLNAMFSRDPYERLFSGYVDKFIFPNIQYWLLRGNGIIQNYRKNYAFHNIRCGDNVKFSEFVKYVIEMSNGIEAVDGHFITVTEHCRPCQVKYDIMGKMESFYNDTTFILERLGQKGMIETLKSKFSKDYRYDQFELQTDLLFFFKKELVTRHKCVKSFHIAQKRAWRALQLRGLIDLHAKYPIPENISDNINKEQFMKALLRGSANKTISRDQKNDAMLDAYASVQLEDLQRLKTIFKSDCDLFGYDCMPLKIFKRSGSIRKDPIWFYDLDTI